MNQLGAYIVLGLMFLYVMLVTVPVANVSSVASDTAGLQGSGGFFFGHLGLVWVLCFIAIVFYWMSGK